MISGCICYVHHMLAAHVIQRNENGGANPILDGQDNIPVVIGRDMTYRVGDLLKQPQRSEKINFSLA